MLRKYLASLWYDWVARMSGGISVLLAFLAAYFEFIIKHGKVALWAAAAVCFVYASYRVWAKEHQALEAKQAELDAVLANKEAVLQGRTKHEHIITSLQEFIKQDGEVNKGMWVEVTHEGVAASRQHDARVKRFLAQYFDEAHVKEYEEKGVVALEKMLVELLR